MPIVLTAVTIGFILVASGLKGVSVVDFLSGGGGSLDPAGGTAETGMGIPSTLTGPGAGVTDTLGGNALRDMAGAAGARGIVEGAAIIARTVSPTLHVVSAHRPGDPRDHGSNDGNKAARDIAKRGVDAIHGPPSAELDRAVVAIGRMFGRDYGDGSRRVVDAFDWNGYRIQILWRTPAYGGHMGHIHIGARKT